LGGWPDPPSRADGGCPLPPSPKLGTGKAKSCENIHPRKIQVISILLEKNDGFEYTDNGGPGVVIWIVLEMIIGGRRFVDRYEVSG
jgi:hypothetical protein